MQFATQSLISYITTLWVLFQVQVEPFRFKLKTGFLLSVQAWTNKAIYVCRLKVIDRKRNELYMQRLYSRKAIFPWTWTESWSSHIFLWYWNKCEIILMQIFWRCSNLYKMIYYHNKERLIFFISFSITSFHVSVLILKGFESKHIIQNRWACNISWGNFNKR